MSLFIPTECGQHGTLQAFVKHKYLTVLDTIMPKPISAKVVQLVVTTFRSVSCVSEAGQHTVHVLECYSGNYRTKDLVCVDKPC